jgi:hypothetical protein
MLPRSDELRGGAWLKCLSALPLSPISLAAKHLPTQPFEEVGLSQSDCRIKPGDRAHGPPALSRGSLQENSNQIVLN